jgi:enoyl-CoA hydratase
VTLEERGPIKIEIVDRVAVVTLNRPEARNALNREIRSTLPRVMLDLDADDGVDVVILTGADPAFTAGIDLKEFGGDATVSPRGPGPDMGERGGDGRLPFRGALPPHAKPIIGAINGVAVTGGLELALSCDFLVASERARFADTHTRVGVQPGWGLTVMLCQSVGVRRAREMSATGNFVDAPTALAWGLVNHVVPHDELLPFCRGLAADIVSNDQPGVRRILQTYSEVSLTTLDEGWTIEDRVSREWEGGGFDPEKVEARRAGIVARGRSQI